MSLYQKMADVRKELSTFEKDKVNAYHKYGYASAAQVFEKIGAAMAKHGLVCLPRIEDIAVSEDGNRYQIRYVFTLADGESGDTIELQWFGESLVGKDDKAINKATTTALKYFLMTTFVVSSDDMPDTDSEGDAPNGAKPVGKKRAVNKDTGEVDGKTPSKRELVYAELVNAEDGAYTGTYHQFESYLMAQVKDGNIAKDDSVEDIVKALRNDPDFWFSQDAETEDES